jgi:hypothetical protein
MGHDFNAAYWEWDALRVALVASCLWLAVFTLRAGWVRWGRQHEHDPHLYVYIVNAVTLVYLAVNRAVDIGHPGEWQCIATAGIVALNFYGLISRNRLSPILRRGDASRSSGAS